jgi:CRISPR-associated endonuclease/helicase Cas3
MKLLKQSLYDAAPPYSECIGKTYTAPNGDVLAGRTVENHCIIVGYVTLEIINRMLDFLKIMFPPGTAVASASHDVGKVSPSFFEKILRLILGYIKNQHPLLKDADPDIEINWGGHAGTSQSAAKHMGAPKYVPEILGSHHGSTPTSPPHALHDKVGGVVWQNEREKLILRIMDEFGTGWPAIPSEAVAKVIAGLTSVSDWIASGPFFENPNLPWREFVSAAVDNAGFIRPRYKKDLSFNDIFGFEPREAQLTLIEHATSPGVYVFEAPMGLGKTEAALYVAYRLLSQDMASGIYFALPTQLTSNKIHGRVDEFLSSILDHDSEYKDAFLIHGSSWLKEMGEEGQPGGDWFNSSKRQILAPFAVGTLDQALMACMNVKHGFVRAFGLMGKVVIIDEAHTYDSYTGTILDNLIELLVSLKCTVIVLSATLTNERRHKITGTPFLNRAGAMPPYPLVTAKCNGHDTISEIGITPTETKNVRITLKSDVVSCMHEAVRRAKEGQQVLWIENTVGDAQKAFRSLKLMAKGVECGLLHSRFIKCQRDENEEKWTELFGKKTSQRNATGRILIGTQVVEQSLDIDADFIVCRFCPTDMLFQRMGRLWRHDRSNRHPNAVCELWLIAPSLTSAVSNPEASFGDTALVYNPYVLCRSLAVWVDVSQVSVPDDMLLFIERTYEDKEEIGDWHVLKDELNNGGTRNGITRKGKNELALFALRGISSGAKTLSEDEVSTRYSEQESIDCLLLASAPEFAEKTTVLTLLNGEQLTLPIKGKVLPKSEWRLLAKKLAQNTVTLNASSAPKSVTVNSLRWLKDYFYLGPTAESPAEIRVAVVASTTEVINIAGFTHDKNRLEYSNTLGFQTIKNGNLL